MKKLVLALISVTAFAESAMAADMAVKAPAYKAAPPVALYNWGGFYIGANGGGGSAHDCLTVLGSSAVGTLTPSQPDGCHTSTGGTAGGQIGYRWQVTNWVFGLEAQGNWADFKGSNLNTAPDGPPGFFNDNTKIDSFGLFTGQVGYAFNNVLIYAKGGAAVVMDKYSATSAIAIPGIAVGTTLFNASPTRWGGTAGAGLEFGFAPNWSVAFEYDHVFVGGNNVNLATVPPLPAGSAFYSIKQNIDIGAVRLNYTFGGPIVAKY